MSRLIATIAGIATITAVFTSVALAPADEQLGGFIDYSIDSEADGSKRIRLNVSPITIDVDVNADDVDVHIYERPRDGE